METLKQEGFYIEEQISLEPYERDHAVVIGSYREKTKVSNAPVKDDFFAKNLRALRGGRGRGRGGPRGGGSRGSPRGRGRGGGGRGRGRGRGRGGGRGGRGRGRGRY